MSLENNPYFKMAQEFIKTHDLSALENGKHVIDGDNLWVNIVDSQMKTPEQARLEVHNTYIDIQIPQSKAETYGIKDRSECLSPAADFDPVKDIQFFNDRFEKTVSAQPGEQVVFAPETAHAPLIGEGTIHKAIFKVKVA